MAPGDNFAAQRSLRTIQTELEYLADLGVISGHTAAQISDLLPVPQPLKYCGSSANNSVYTPGSEYGSHQTATSPYIEKSVALPVREKAHTPNPEPTPAPPPAYAPPADAFRAKALWAYEEKNPGDLNFKAGQYVLVLKKENEEWWSGRVIDSTTNEPKGDAGIFPCAYVEAVKEEKGHVSGDMGTGFLNNSFGGSGNNGEPSKAETQGKKFGKKLGNAAIFGAGATLGGKIVNGIF